MLIEILAAIPIYLFMKLIFFPILEIIVTFQEAGISYFVMQHLTQ